MTFQPDLCAQLDERYGFLPGTMAMRHLVTDVIFRQDQGTWVANTTGGAVDTIDADGKAPLAGLGATPADAMADLWRKAATGLLEVHPVGGREPYRTRWDVKRGWSVP